mmetsp:Transcript_20253/g.56431  ORF Transcript_20253/g.56431 Transcript_20253/m.56431 type:complete len:375 (-) Transcript_20253:258-1382(-)|eukprot:CAMPEP_0198112050 /NCGR_PEP_ID=MMETSP1442-20131203/3947_1 /TAXON_ID= /ORGANISM="Craspedostauros australis, Strain CCMP3328" /LENGTH=374 /DNA_ID=CAMNT_0043768693 /DNA_START=309 /DNA_END=1433 /DNA_ORIENTATION=+
MNVGGFINAITGGGGFKVGIQLTQQENQKRIAMDHYPSWKLHRNPFWRVKHPHGAVKRAPPVAAPPPMMDPHTGQMIPQPQAVEHEKIAYEASQDVGGIVTIHSPPGKKAEHLGIRVQFIGRIEMGYGVNEGRPNHDFVSLSKELAPPGMMYQPTIEVPFLFRNMDKEHESYYGRHASVRYFIKVVMERKFLPPLTKEKDVWVQRLGIPPTVNAGIKLEVGIEDCLHIEFEYDRRVYHLQDVISGKIHFLLVRIKIKHMELGVIRRETSGEGVAAIAHQQQMGATSANTAGAGSVVTETQTLVKYEIMDGAPVKGEVIPVKLSLNSIPADLTPTYEVINNRFSVRYYVNLVLVDEEDRRYFKQQEIILWRKELG